MNALRMLLIENAKNLNGQKWEKKPRRFLVRLRKSFIAVLKALLHFHIFRTMHSRVHQNGQMVGYSSQNLYIWPLALHVCLTSNKFVVHFVLLFQPFHSKIQLVFFVGRCVTVNVRFWCCLIYSLQSFWLRFRVSFQYLWMYFWNCFDLWTLIASRMKKRHTSRSKELTKNIYRLYLEVNHFYLGSTYFFFTGLCIIWSALRSTAASVFFVCVETHKFHRIH